MRRRADRNDAGSAYTHRVPSRPAPDASSVDASGSAGRRCPACGRSGSRNSLTEPSRHAGSCGNTSNQIAAALLAMAVIERVSAMAASRQMVLIVTCQSCPISFVRASSCPQTLASVTERPFSVSVTLNGPSQRGGCWRLVHRVTASWTMRFSTTSASAIMSRTAGGILGPQPRRFRSDSRTGERHMSGSAR